MSKEKELLFSVTAKDFDIQFFCAGGHGGQNMQKNATACRIVHKDSKAVGVSRDERSQLQNKKKAFLRCIETKEFKSWHRLETAKRLDNITNVEEQLERDMQSKNLKVEKFDSKTQKWIEYCEDIK